MRSFPSTDMSATSTNDSAIAGGTVDQREISPANASVLVSKECSTDCGHRPSSEAGILTSDGRLCPAQLFLKNGRH